MFISDVAGSCNKEELYNVIIHDLRHVGVKQRIKKGANKHSQVSGQLDSAVALNFHSEISFYKF
jgi:hypothetical protein